MQVELRSSQLRVLSSMLSNVASALLVTPFTVSSVGVLTASFVFAIVLFTLAVRLEDELDKL